MAEPTDEDLLNRYFLGDAKAVRLFVERHSGRVVAYAEAKGLRKEIALEVAQEAFLKLHRFIHQYEKGRPALAWFFTIVHRCVVDSFREKYRKEDPTSAEFFESLCDDPEESHERKRFSGEERNIELILSILTEEQRTLVRSRVFEGLTFKEIAVRTGKNESALRKTYERARSSLRSHFGEEVKTL